MSQNVPDYILVPCLLIGNRICCFYADSKFFSLRALTAACGPVVIFENSLWSKKSYQCFDDTLSIWNYDFWFQ